MAKMGLGVTSWGRADLCTLKRFYKTRNSLIMGLGVTW
jgi:hypothetical protein